MPKIPNVDATISLTKEQTVNLMVASIAFEELAQAHILNAEGEKIQYVLGTLEGATPLETPPTFDQLLQVNKSVERTLRDVIKNQMLLQFKLEDTMEYSQPAAQ